MHLADSANFKGVTSNKLCNGLTGSCFESPNDTIHVTVVGYYDLQLETVKNLIINYEMDYSNILYYDYCFLFAD
ncbi:hypothetical protein SAMN06265379_1172 [Saccharicrinis carchari]|uniref:Uncharacterized protein n=1 Tax=Saccharicrinis carchari TaxID=1168039 RepID=A0A521F979_SACCC|nr:hypothetical protein SAMN06265379_1172 [Saccharicrinis carchari]